MKEFSVYGLGSGGSKCVDMIARHLIMAQEKAIFRIYDYDNVSPFNVWNQLYSMKDVGKNKMVALNNHLATLENESDDDFITVKLEAINGYDREPKGITLVMVDSMAARRKIYLMWKEAIFSSSVLIENRLDAECVATYCVTRHTEVMKRYENTLYDDPPVDENRDVCKVRESSYISTLNAVLAAKYALKGGVDCPFETMVGLADPITIMTKK